MNRKLKYWLIFLSVLFLVFTATRSRRQKEGGYSNNQIFAISAFGLAIAFIVLFNVRKTTAWML